MIDFENPSFLKLRPVSDSKLARLVSPLLCPGEQIIQEFQSVRDGVIFTDRRVIAINIQGVTGMKKAYTILPYKRVHRDRRHRRSGRRAAAVVFRAGHGPFRAAGRQRPGSPLSGHRDRTGSLSASGTTLHKQPGTGPF